MTNRKKILSIFRRAAVFLLFDPHYRAADKVWSDLFAEMAIMQHRIQDAEELSEGDVADLVDLASRYIRYIASNG